MHCVNYNTIDAVNGSLAFLANSTDEGDVLTVCLGEIVSLTCTHDNVAGEVTQWTTSGTVSCSVLVSHVVNSGSEQPCGQTPFTITMISDDTGPVVSSTIRTTATEALDGTVIECFAGGLSSSPRIGNTTVNVIGIHVIQQVSSNLFELLQI